MFRPKPTFLKVLFTQYFYPTDILIVVGMLFVWDIILSIVLSGYPLSFNSINFLSATLAIGIVLTAIGILPRWQKTSFILSVLVNGIEISGNVIDAYSTKYRGGYVTYEYSFRGHTYRSTDRVRLTRKTKDLHIGQNVILLVNDKNPSQAFIRELYL